MRRVQRFIANFALDSDLVAKLIFRLLPEKENLKFSIDRTNWKFGKTDINIFMLGVTYRIKRKRINSPGASPQGI